MKSVNAMLDFITDQNPGLITRDRLISHEGRKDLSLSCELRALEGIQNQRRDEIRCGDLAS